MTSIFRSRLQASLDTNKAQAVSKYLQLATVRPDGRPANRTVVFRGFLGDSDVLTFVTDQRSSKVAEVASNPAAEVCWYFPTTREQYRISGDLRVVTSSDTDARLQQARRAAWAAMSDTGRTQFTWPEPGRPRFDGDADAFKLPAPGPAEPPTEHFCLVTLQPAHADLVQLFTNEREVLEHRGGAAGGWSPSGWLSVNP